MKNFLLTLILTTLLPLTSSAQIPTDAIAVIYNSKVPESKTLATYYASQRNIPIENLIGLPLPDVDQISRQEYIDKIEIPIRKEFRDRNWWNLTTTAQGLKLPSKNKIRLLVTVRGVPFGINRVPITADPKAPKSNNPFPAANEASVDSELTVIGIHELPIAGPINNKYFKSTKPFTQENLPFEMLVGRIDGPSYATAKRLIDDAIATEKTGLWGMAYLDLRKSGSGYELGDKWLTNIESQNWLQGIPTVIDKNTQTYLTNYPMRDAALYYGWYTGNVNGPFLNPDLKLKKGAIAVHLHSFSAQNLRHPNTKWVGPLLEKGAAATLGNVYEPYLQVSHNFDLFNKRLLDGSTLVEAAQSSIPALSWQGVVIGDPLYRPFIHINGGGKITEEDKLYRAINIAFTRWANDPETMISKLRSVGAKKRDGRYYEIIGLWNLYKKNMQGAAAFFTSAQKIYFTPNDQIRITVHLANMYREIKNNAKAAAIVRAALKEFPDQKASQTLKSILNILEPPAPKPAEPKKK